MKCNQSCPGIELVSPCPYPVTITITPRAPSCDDDDDDDDDDFSLHIDSVGFSTKLKAMVTNYLLPEGRKLESWSDCLAT